MTVRADYHEVGCRSSGEFSDFGLRGPNQEVVRELETRAAESERNCIEHRVAPAPLLFHKCRKLRQIKDIHDVDRGEFRVFGPRPAEDFVDDWLARSSGVNS